MLKTRTLGTGFFLGHFYRSINEHPPFSSHLERGGAKISAPRGPELLGKRCLEAPTAPGGGAGRAGEGFAGPHADGTIGRRARGGGAARAWCRGAGIFGTPAFGAAVTAAVGTASLSAAVVVTRGGGAGGTGRTPCGGPVRGGTSRSRGRSA